MSHYYSEFNLAAATIIQNGTNGVALTLILRDDVFGFSEDLATVFSVIGPKIGDASIVLGGNSQDLRNVMCYGGLNVAKIITMIPDIVILDLLEGRVEAKIILTQAFLTKLANGLDNPSLIFDIVKYGFSLEKMRSHGSVTDSVCNVTGREEFICCSGARFIDTYSPGSWAGTFDVRGLYFIKKKKIMGDFSRIAAFFLYGAVLDKNATQHEIDTITPPSDFGFSSVERMKAFLEIVQRITIDGAFEKIQEAEDLWEKHGGGPPERSQTNDPVLSSMLRADPSLMKQKIEAGWKSFSDGMMALKEAHVTVQKIGEILSGNDSVDDITEIKKPSYDIKH